MHHFSQFHTISDPQKGKQKEGISERDGSNRPPLDRKTPYPECSQIASHLLTTISCSSFLGGHSVAVLDSRTVIGLEGCQSTVS